MRHPSPGLEQPPGGAAMSAVVSAGFGRADVTPPPDTPLCGFAARDGVATGVHDRLYARAVVVGDPDDGARTALVACDVIGLDVAQTTEIRRRVEEATGIPADAVVVAATHTHGGPPTMPGRLGGRVDDGYVDRLVVGAVAAVVRANAARVPARLGFAVGREPHVAHNRRDPDGPIDPSVGVVRVDGTDGGVLGLVCQYACHPVTLGPDNREVTADYPGYVVRALERRHPGAVALFVTGCAGNVNTGHSAADSVSGRGSSRRTFAEAERIGEALADAAAHAVEDALLPGAPDGSSVGAAVRAVRLPLQPVEPRQVLLDRAEAWRRESATADAGHALLLALWADWAERVASDAEPATHVDATVSALRWGDVTLVALPGEPFVELGLEIRRRTDRPVVVLGYANGVPGYVPDRSAYATGGYEPCEAHRFYGQPAAFAPEASELLVRAALDAIDSASLP